MFKRFGPEEISSQGQIKSSSQRAIRSKLLEYYPKLESILEDILPKKSSVVVAKCPNHVQVVFYKGEPLFFGVRDGPWYPTLRLVHRCKEACRCVHINSCLLVCPPDNIAIDPGFMHEVQVDKGAIRFVLGGAHIMCPGLTSAGGKLEDGLEAETPVVIKAEGKEMELGIGNMKMSTQEIREKNKDIGIELLHHLNDGLWRTESI